MRAVVQRVRRASVRVAGETVGEIGPGLLVLLGIGKGDTDADADWMIKKLLALRIFADDDRKMNRSVTDTAGSLLVVSQFTLYGELRKGTRPSFSEAMAPAEAEKFYGGFMAKLRQATALPVAEGKFAAMMDVELVNDGPVTIIVERASSPFDSAAEGTGRMPVPLAGNGLEARSTFVPFDPTTPVAKHDRNLPHWEQPGRTYFVTFRLADSLPRARLARWLRERDEWRRQHPAPLTPDQQSEYERLFDERFEDWLDAGHGACWLRQPAVADLVARALRHFDGERYVLGAHVIMPNHVHVLVTPLGEGTIEQILHSWKSYTANEINRVLRRTGTVWQAEYFDHIVRDEQALARFEAYIQENPRKAGLRDDEYILG